MKHCQLLLFPRSRPTRLQHRWMWHPDFNQCARCGVLWFASFPRFMMVNVMQSDCPGPLRSSSLQSSSAGRTRGHGR